MNLTELYDRGNQVTLKHLERRNGKKWNIHEQINLIHSEVSEVYDTKRRPQKYQCPIQEFLLESCDIIYATLTALNLEGYTAEEFETAMELTLQKIENRVK